MALLRRYYADTVGGEGTAPHLSFDTIYADMVGGWGEEPNVS